MHSVENKRHIAEMTGLAAIQSFIQGVGGWSDGTAVKSSWSSSRGP